jgi:hypothetical protein
VAAAPAAVAAAAVAAVAAATAAAAAARSLLMPFERLRLPSDPPAASSKVANAPRRPESRRVLRA